MEPAVQAEKRFAWQPRRQWARHLQIKARHAPEICTTADLDVK